jgi:7-cyano-7-deazaguanine synthase
MTKVIVLSSGGLDSTTCVGMAVKEFGKENVTTVSILYGQKHSKELACAKKVADYYGVNHILLNLVEVFKYSNCPLLLKNNKNIKHQSYAKQIEENSEGMVETYVPFRNGLMLSAVATYAMSVCGENDKIVILLGAHADDAAGCAYADCSLEFVNAMDEAISIGTYGKVSLLAPFVNSHKADIVKKGLELGVPYKLTWSCYEGGKKACGTCGTCIDRLAAFEANGVKDPIKYKGE